MRPTGTVIGSRAMSYWYPDARSSVQSDVDVYISEHELSGVLQHLDHWSMGRWGVYIGYYNNLKLEIHKLESTHPLNHPQLSVPMVESFLTLPFQCRVATPEALLAFKKSHVHAPVHWFKTIQDYHFLQHKINTAPLSKPAAELCEYEHRYVDDRIRVHTALNKDAFFNQHHVVRYIEHDALHERIKIHAKPMYQLYLKDGADVQCDLHKWNALSLHQQLDGVREEACVLAVERILLPAHMQNSTHALSWNPLQSYRWALMRICTNLTSGWFRQFAVEHYPDLSVLTIDIARITSQLATELKTV